MKILIPSFYKDGKHMFHNRKLGVLRFSVADILELSHDSKISGHCLFLKTFSVLEKYHWIHKGSDVKRYIEGWTTCHQNKDHIGKKLIDLS